MTNDLQHALDKQAVAYALLSKAEKVKMLAKWTKVFPELLQSARADQHVPRVERDARADECYRKLQNIEFSILPDDASSMPSYQCEATTAPDLQALVSDTFTACDELVVVEKDFSWSAVFVNHGSPERVGRHFQTRDPNHA